MSKETTNTGEKKGHLRVTLDVEINEELLNAAKDSMATISQHMPNMMRRGGSSEKNKHNRVNDPFSILFLFS